MSNDNSILSLIRRLDEEIELAAKNLHDAQEQLLHIRTQYAAARETLDQMARMMGFGRQPSLPLKLEDTTVPYPQLSQDALDQSSASGSL